MELSVCRIKFRPLNVFLSSVSRSFTPPAFSSRPVSALSPHSSWGLGPPVSSFQVALPEAQVCAGAPCRGGGSISSSLSLPCRLTWKLPIDLSAHPGHRSALSRELTENQCITPTERASFPVCKQGSWRSGLWGTSPWPPLSRSGAGISPWAYLTLKPFLSY